MTHEERLRLIHRPFFLTTFAPSYPHGGTAVTDTFGVDNDDAKAKAKQGWAERSRPAEKPGSGDDNFGLRFKRGRPTLLNEGWNGR